MARGPITNTGAVGNGPWLTGCLFMITMTIQSYAQYNPPHIVFIMADDMGWNDVSFHGSNQIFTPNIDALAFQSVILQDYYSEAICTPARSALLTGKYPMRLGMQGFPLYNSEDRGIPLKERLLPSYLKDLGYSTHLVGKWHVGMSRNEFLPTARGYDSHYGMRGGFIDYYTYNKYEMWPNGREMFGLDLFDDHIPQENERRYSVDALTDRAISIIEHHNVTRPLFLHLTHNAPHSGNQGGALQPPLYSTVENRHIAEPNRRLYAEIVSHLDYSIGRLVNALDEKGIISETIIVFVSDNGAPTTGELRNWGVNLPFRGKKSTPWEGGVRVPSFIWHSSFRPRVWNGLMHITDWLPTLVAAAGGVIKSNIDGVNQWDAIIRDGQSKRKEVLIAVENNFAAYRAGEYKVIIGNLTGVSSEYYGAELMKIKENPPDYFATLQSCEIARIFRSMGIFFDSEEVEAMRNITTIKKIENFNDSVPCIPTPTKGCLYNIRRDPTESRDIWMQAQNIAILLTNRLQALWLMQQRRGPPALRVEADPANFNYVWTPWINTYGIDCNNAISINNTFLKSDNTTNNNNNIRSGTTSVNTINCNDNNGFRHFLCVLRSLL